MVQHGRSIEVAMSPNSGIAKPEEIKSQSVKPTSAKVNLTLKLNKELVRKVRVLAAEKGTSVSALLAEKLEEEVSRRAEYEESRKRWLLLVAKGMNLGGRPLTREQMHER
jgi:predicted transcriptional regulator